MAVTPNDILSKTFERSFRGYDEDQVDEFLDVLKEEIERINEENHLLMGQIMSLEEEIQTQRADGGSTLSGVEAPVDLDERAKAGIESAKATATRIISEAKETAEHIVQAANKKATEMMTRIEAERKRTGQPSGGGEEISAAQESAAEIIEQAKKRAGAMMIQAKAEAQEQANSILEQAKQRAASAESDMNTRLTDAKQQLESIQNAVKAYKAKLETFINGQSQAFQGFDPNVPGFDPKELNIQKTTKPTVPVMPEVKSPEPEKTVIPEPPAAAIPEPIVKSEPIVAPEPQAPKYQPYKATENDKGYADDLKFSGFDIGKTASAQTPVSPEPQEERPTVSSVLSGGAQQKPEPVQEPQKKESLIMDDSDERYRQVLSQIRNIEKSKDELKARHDSASIESVNPVKDMTGKVEQVTQKSKDTSSSVIISDEDDFVGRISAAAPIEWDEPVPMSDEEKRHLREMLDDML